MTVLDLGNNIAVTRQITPQVLSASSSDATAVDLAGEGDCRHGNSRRYRRSSVCHRARR